MKKERVLVISSARGLLRSTKRALVSAGYEVETVVPPPPPVDRPFDLFIVDVDVDPGEYGDFLEKQLRHAPNTATLLLTKELFNQLVVDQILDRGLNNVIARHGGLAASREHIDESELIATVKKLLSKDIFGMERYLPVGGIEVHRRTISHSQERADALEELEDFLSQIDCYSSIQPMVVATADELLMNAIFSAPRDASGKPKYDERDRRERFPLEPNERVKFEYACDGRQVLISVSDQFGALDREILLKYLGRSLAQNKGEAEEKKGGAGLGLVMIVHNITQLVFNIEKNRRTEIIASFYVRSGLRAFRSSGQSLNLFIIE